MVRSSRPFVWEAHNESLLLHALEERRRAEAALAFAASIVESSDDAIIGTTLDGMITSWNASAERLFGYSAPEVLGRWRIGITLPRTAWPPRWRTRSTIR
jgi:PAS domain-containing protein